ncbi:hypothetical protein H2203_004048 [Taxawa tesnikishii (nom. ined.)]|nr:hypothetical protein H2203_004048 [Dothideales sp. JES 119]
MAPITPLEAPVEMFERGKRQSLFDASRPLSQATEIFDTDFEDDNSDFEEDSDNSPKGSFETFDTRRRSQTTISSYDEAPTPRSNNSRPFEIRFKPVEGPKGPHLFRASQSSVDFTFDYALQMSPLLPKEQRLEPPPRTETAFSQATVTQERHHENMPSIDAAFAPAPSHDIRQWSAEQVVDWMYGSGLEQSIIEKLEQHDIDGAVLMDLQFDDLKELDIHSFGKRHTLWNAICGLRGGEGRLSPVPTPFEDISRPATAARSKSDGDVPRSACPDTPMDDLATPISAGGVKKRRSRKNKHLHNDITPAESVSIVAIEQLMPKPHNCNKGERCPKWRKQQRLIARIQAENGWPISPLRGGHIVIEGNPGNASTANNILPNVRPDPFRPTSEAVPSVVASSDLLGPGQLPEFALHEDVLQRVEHRDPQENVKQFLNFQHISESPVESPPTPPLEMFPAEHHEMFSSRRVAKAQLCAPALNEGEVFSPVSNEKQTYIDAGPNARLPVSKEPTEQYGPNVTHAGWMKKRKNKLLRHDWHDAHFRLKGTQLAMHANNRLSSAALDTIDVDDYAVACTSLASNNKITAALRSLKISDKKARDVDPAAFAFQLVPSSERDRAKAAAGKTHHFAVKTSDERIDWMRELMLAKARQQKEAGFSVEVNGEKGR